MYFSRFAILSVSESKNLIPIHEFDDVQAIVKQLCRKYDMIYRLEEWQTQAMSMYNRVRAMFLWS